jgi:hypothetical protein
LSLPLGKGIYAYSLFKIQSHFPVPVAFVPTLEELGTCETFVPLLFLLLTTIQYLPSSKNVYSVIHHIFV